MSFGVEWAHDGCLLGAVARACCCVRFFSLLLTCVSQGKNNAPFSRQAENEDKGETDAVEPSRSFFFFVFVGTRPCGTAADWERREHVRWVHDRVRMGSMARVKHETASAGCCTFFFFFG